MNQYTFAMRNIYDKFGKVKQNKDMLAFYWQTYILSRLERIEPDMFIVSYPKCGRTWLRTMMQKYLELTNARLRYFHDKSLLGVAGIGTIKFEHDQGTWIPAPPKLKHLSFNANKYAGKKVVFLVRDPRDVLVSSWYHLKYREQIYQGDLAAFIREDLTGIHKVVAFTNMWMENRHRMGDFLLMTYEDMHREPAAQAQQMVAFLGLEVRPELIDQAVEASSFENMKKMELEGSMREPWMKPGSKDLKNSLKIRKGKVGGFHSELSESDIAYVNRVIQEHLHPELPYHQSTR
jgi:hypothetical protein